MKKKRKMSKDTIGLLQLFATIVFGVALFLALSWCLTNGVF